MTIYFAGSIRGGRDDQETYKQLISHLQTHGQVLCEHIGDPALTSAGEQADPQMIFQRDLDWLHQADVVVAEVSTPSLGVGYELRTAEQLGKQVLCLFRPQEGKHLSAMILGNPKFTVREYRDIAEAKESINQYMKGGDTHA